MARKPREERPPWADEFFGEEQANPKKGGWIGDADDCGAKIIEPHEDYVPHGHKFTIVGFAMGPLLVLVIILLGVCGQ